MARVSEDDMKPQYSLSPPVSSIPSKRTPSAPGPMGSEEDVPDADIPSSQSTHSNPDIPSPIVSQNQHLECGGPSTLYPQIGRTTAELNAAHEDCLLNPPSVDMPLDNVPYVRRSTRDIRLTQKARLRNVICTMAYVACQLAHEYWRGITIGMAINYGRWSGPLAACNRFLRTPIIYFIVMLVSKIIFDNILSTTPIFTKASKITCDDTYLNKSWCIVGQGMFKHWGINRWSARCAPIWNGN
ncbi:hypothetical protein EI94DRAFT_1698202 [Lactarius quietus]|nr:hypothetical protein EI94DRAFT_1698202 [Lactarius quietus]